jgi:Peptidase inhibitor family I36
MSCARFAVVTALQSLVFAYSGCAPSVERTQPAALSEQALTASEWLVALRTNDDRHYLTAESGGGDTVSSDRTAVGPWERWLIRDLNGGALQSGDAINLRYVADSGTSWWATADVNGGGPGSVLRFNRRQPSDWETFVITDAPGEAITSGELVTFRAASQPFFVSTQLGGGVQGDGAVLVDRPDATTWEILTVLAIDPAELCPFANTLCLFERPNFGGARFELAALDGDMATCVDLGAQDWAGRARSAVNTQSHSVMLTANADCSGDALGIAANGMESLLPALPNGAFVF